MNRPERLKEFKEHIITLTYRGQEYKIPQGTTAEEFLSHHARDGRVNDPYEKDPVIALQVNKEVMSLSQSLVIDGTAEPVRMFSPIGKRMYRHTLSYLLAYASHTLFPSRRLVIGHSLGNGFYFSYEDLKDLPPEDITALETRMRRMCESALPIRLYIAAYEQATDYFGRIGFKATRQLLDYRNDPTIPLYACGDFLDISFEPLLSNSSLTPLWELRSYGSCGLLLRYPLSSSYTSMPPFRDNPLLFSVFNESKEWGTILKVDCIGAMNAICGSDQIRTFIRMNENLQQRKISSVAEDIAEKKQDQSGVYRRPFLLGKDHLHDETGPAA